MMQLNTASTVWALTFIIALCTPSSTSGESDGAATPKPRPIAEGLGHLLGLPFEADVTSESDPPAFMMDMYKCWTEAGAENCLPEGDTAEQMAGVDVLRSFMGQIQSELMVDHLQQLFLLMMHSTAHVCIDAYAASRACIAKSRVRCHVIILPPSSL